MYFILITQLLLYEKKPQQITDKIRQTYRPPPPPLPLSFTISCLVCSLAGDEQLLLQPHHLRRLLNQIQEHKQRHTM